MTPDIHTLTGAYALDALTDAERREFQAHLAACPSCDQEVREFAETAARIGSTCAIKPPAALKAEVMGALRTTRQVSPRLSGTSASPRRAQRWPGRRLGAGLAAAVAAAIALSVATVDAEHRADRAQALANAVTSVLSAPDVHAITGPAGSDASVTVLESRLRDKVVLVSADLRAAPPTKSYQGWLIGPNGARSAGLLTVNAAGGAAPLVASGLGGATAFGLTVEPAGGSAKPSTPPLTLLRLPT